MSNKIKKEVPHDVFLTPSKELKVNAFQKGKYYTIFKDDKSFRGTLMYNTQTKQHVLSGWTVPDKRRCHIALVHIELNGWSLIKLVK